MDQRSQATLCTLRSATHASTIATVDNIEAILANDEKVRVAGVDADGILRGKIMDKEKFLSCITGGFGMSSAIFAWDIHDVLFTTETKIATSEDGFADFVAFPDLSSFRRLPTEDDIPFFLLSFAGRQNLSTFLEKNTPSALRPLTGGMFGYSTSRPIASKKYFHEIFDFSKKANCGLEGWHTESGPGVYEAALTVSPIDEMADKVSIFKYFLAGILVALPDIMPLLAPSINSYKRLVENFWAPVDISWGLEDRLASVRLIAPPVCKPAATRFEVRIPGADLHPHYALTAIVAAGWRGVMKKLDIPIPPAKIQRKDTKPELLPDSLLEATHRFKAPDSLAREILGDDFVDLSCYERT
ncbi:hypothetical protein KNSL1_007251 [Colletotrichum chrysophilum]|nr:hypothetical protein KNSL1_007251 [Colletotrichum chrysophilum]